jgi:hypothetical protein
VKRRELVKKIEEQGAILIRHGGDAAMGSWRECGSTNDQNLARSILRTLAKS